MVTSKTAPVWTMRLALFLWLAAVGAPIAAQTAANCGPLLRLDRTIREFDQLAKQITTGEPGSALFQLDQSVRTLDRGTIGLAIRDTRLQGQEATLQGLMDQAEALVMLATGADLGPARIFLAQADLAETRRAASRLLQLVDCEDDDEDVTAFDQVQSDRAAAAGKAAPEPITKSRNRTELIDWQDLGWIAPYLVIVAIGLGVVAAIRGRIFLQRHRDRRSRKIGQRYPVNFTPTIRMGRQETRPQCADISRSGLKIVKVSRGTEITAGHVDIKVLGKWRQADVIWQNDGFFGLQLRRLLHIWELEALLLIGRAGLVADADPPAPAPDPAAPPVTT